LLYLVEGLSAFVFIATQWAITSYRQVSFGGMARGATRSRVARLLDQLAKRDLAHLTFLVLALVRLTPWILHTLFIYSLGGLVLTLRSLRDHKR
jgi:hypothetical protein